MKLIQHVHFAVLATLAIVIAVKVAADLHTLAYLEGPLLFTVALTGWVHAHNVTRR